MTTQPNQERSKCEDIGFEHCWEDTTPNVVYPTYPPRYPPKTRKCRNCGREESEVVKQKEIREWQSD